MNNREWIIILLNKERLYSGFQFILLMGKQIHVLSNVVWFIFILVVSWSIYAHIKINFEEGKNWQFM